MSVWKLYYFICGTLFEYNIKRQSDIFSPYIDIKPPLAEFCQKGLVNGSLLCLENIRKN